MKYLKITVVLFALIIGLYACGSRTENPKPSFQSKDTIAATEADTAPATTNESHNNAPIDAPIFDRLEVRCKEIESLYHALYESAEKTVPDTPWDDSCLSQSSIDSIEDLLYDAGYDVMDTNEPYPEYLTTTERFYVFWDAVQQNKDTEQEVITILKSGGLSYRLFTYDESGAFVYSMTYYPDEIKEPYYECHEIKDWALTEKGNFY